MKYQVRKFVALAVLVSFSFGITGCATYQIHPEFKERHKNIKSVSVMPPEVDAYILTFQGDRKMLNDLIPIMGKTTSEELEKIIVDKGYELKKMDLSEEALKNNPDLKTSLFHVNEVFKKSLEDIAKRKKSKFTYELGSDVNRFANLAATDILIFVKEDGIKKSAGEIAKDLAKGLAISAACILIGAIYVPVPQTSATIVHLAVVDGNDGAILWYNNNAAAPNWDPENQKQLATLIKSLIGPFPDSVFKKKDINKEIIEKTKPVSTGTEITPAATATKT